MEYYIKQRFFSWNDRFSIYDASGNVRFYVEGEVFSWGKKLHLSDVYGNELAFIEQKLFSWKPRYYIHRPGANTLEVVKEFTFFKDRYFVNGIDWRVEGDVFDHSYEIIQGNDAIVGVSREWFSLGDAYAIRTAYGIDDTAALAVVLVIDACIEAERY